MTTILVAADAPWIRDLVKASCLAPGTRVIEATRGIDVRDLVAREVPDVVVLDQQIANMGGIAVTLDLRLESAAGRVPHTPILLLLDRPADTFLGRRANADVMLVKPVDPSTLCRTVESLLAGGSAAGPTGEPEAAAR